MLSRKEKVQKMCWKYVRLTFVDVLSKVLLCKRFKQFQWCYICIWWCAIKKKKIAENVGKYLVTEETEETPKTTCTGNQPWAARFVENILNTRETEDTLPENYMCRTLRSCSVCGKYFGSWRNWRYTRENDMHRNLRIG